jgi:hypothetical protein
MRRNPPTALRSINPALPEFEKYCILFGLEPKDYNRQFKSNGTVFTIYGLNLKAKTMPVLARTTDGRGFKFGAETVKRLLG